MKTMYEYIGREQLEYLVDIFYRNVQEDKELATIFPGDWDETIRKQKLFLMQFLGGPQEYSMERGHPMMRARHMPFPITIELAERWLANMDKAMEEVALDPHIREPFFEQLRRVAYHMVNTESEKKS